MTSFDWSILVAGRYHDWLLAGLVLSLKLWLITLLLALPLALVLALARRSPWPLLRGLTQALVEAVRNVPLLAHMLFWYFGAPELVPAALKDWLYAHDYEAVAAVCALLFYTAAYMSEDMRSGLRAVPAVQVEAARALGLGFWATMRLVVLPQALRLTVPPLLSQTLNLWKNTSIATVIGTAELMYQTAQVETTSFRSAEAFAFATACYLGVSLLIGAAAAWYQHAHPVRTT